MCLQGVLCILKSKQAQWTSVDTVTLYWLPLVYYNKMKYSLNKKVPFLLTSLGREQKYSLVFAPFNPGDLFISFFFVFFCLYNLFTLWGLFRLLLFFGLLILLLFLFFLGFLFFGCCLFFLLPTSPWHSY